MLYPVTPPGGSSGQVQYNNAGAFGGAAALAYAASTTHLTVTAQAATDVPLLLKGAGSQSANLFEVRNSSSTLLARVTAAGAIHGGGTATETADSSNPGTYLGIVSGTPRVIFKDSSSNLAQIDLDTLKVRHIVNGGIRMVVGAATTGGVGFEKCEVGNTDLTKLDTFVRVYSWTLNASVHSFGAVGEETQSVPMYLNRLKSSTGTVRDAAGWVTTWATSTDASRKARATFTTYDTSARECLRLEASGSAAMIGVLGASAVVRQTGGEDVTNNVTDSGSTAGVIPDITDGTTYANDYTNLRRALYQLARLVKQDHDALRLYGWLT